MHRVIGTNALLFQYLMTSTPTTSPTMFYDQTHFAGDYNLGKSPTALHKVQWFSGASIAFAADIKLRNACAKCISSSLMFALFIGTSTFTLPPRKQRCIRYKSEVNNIYLLLRQRSYAA